MGQRCLKSLSSEAPGGLCVPFKAEVDTCVYGHLVVEGGGGPPSSDVRVCVCVGGGAFQILWAPMGHVSLQPLCMCVNTGVGENVSVQVYLLTLLFVSERMPGCVHCLLSL